MKKLVMAATALAATLTAAAPAAAITNGTVDTTHDYVGVITGVDPTGTERRCSGSLIDEGVFLIAGHCAGLTNVVVHFGDDIAIEHTTFAATSVVRHPQYAKSIGNKYDVGVVLFDQGGAELPMGQLAPENYLDTFTKPQLKAATFEAIGYGLVRVDTNGNSAPVAPTTLRHIATQTYLNQHDQYLGLSIHNNKDNGGACFGDSGGPHLLNDYIVSITSSGDGQCVATDHTMRVDDAEIRNWILGFTS